MIMNLNFETHHISDIREYQYSVSSWVNSTSFLVSTFVPLSFLKTNIAKPHNTPLFLGRRPEGGFAAKYSKSKPELNRSCITSIFPAGRVEPQLNTYYATAGDRTRGSVEFKSFPARLPFLFGGHSRSSGAISPTLPGCARVVPIRSAAVSPGCSRPCRCAHAHCGRSG